MKDQQSVVESLQLFIVLMSLTFHFHQTHERMHMKYMINLT